MAELLATRRDEVPYSNKDGSPIVKQFPWDVVAASNNDTVHVGYLPAFHRLVPELCCAIADGSTPAFTYSLMIDNDTNALISGDAVTASTFKRTASGLTKVVQDIGVSAANRKVYFKLTTAPASGGGKLIAQLGYAPALA